MRHDLDPLTTLNDWLSTRGNHVHGSTADAWNITPYRDGFVVSPSGGARSNVLYLVRGDAVTTFSPATTTLAAAYDALLAPGR